MKVKDILRVENIALNVSAITKEEVIKQLSGLLFKSGMVNNYDRFLQDVFIREEVGFTGAGKGIAIPHGISRSVHDVAIAIGKLVNPIDWDTKENGYSEEEKKVTLVILFAVPEEDKYLEKRNHLEALKLIMQKLAEHETLQQLLQADNEREIISILETSNEGKEV